MNVRANREAFAAEPSTIGNVPVKRLQTGKEYLESLDGVREVSSTATRSRTSLRTRPSATPRAWWRVSTTPCRRQA